MCVMAIYRQLTKRKTFRLPICEALVEYGLHLIKVFPTILDLVEIRNAFPKCVFVVPKVSAFLKSKYVCECVAFFI